MSEFGRSTDMLWDSVSFFLDVQHSSGYWGWAPARGSGWRRTWTPWCCISLSASFIRCFQPQEAQCLRCKITLIQPAKEGDTRWNKIYREMKRDTTRKWMDAHGCTHFVGPFGTRKQKAPRWAILNWHACTQVRGKWQARSTEVFKQGQDGCILWYSSVL